MNEKQITNRLVAAHAAYVEKTGKQPWMEPNSSLGTDGEVRVWLRPTSVNDTLDGQGETFAAALDALDAKIAAIPSAEEQARQKAQKAVAAAIEACREAGADAEFLNPLYTTAKRLSENALTFQAPEPGTLSPINGE